MFVLESRVKIQPWFGTGRFSWQRKVLDLRVLIRCCLCHIVFGYNGCQRKKRERRYKNHLWWSKSIIFISLAAIYWTLMHCNQRAAWFVNFTLSNHCNSLKTLFKYYFANVKAEHQESSSTLPNLCECTMSCTCFVTCSSDHALSELFLVMFLQNVFFSDYD
jgi:hypothetical protein